MLVSLKSAIESGDHKRIQMLDPVVAAKFETILSYSPKTNDEARRLFSFLMTQLASEGGWSELQERITEKLTSLVEETAKRHSRLCR